MWCTRWFLPLLLLPLPIASPYFLFLFFFSLTLHARPCFYCIILLTALFTSSCYWQPVPTRILLKASLPNVTHDSPLWYQPNATLSDEGAISPSQLRPMPSLTRLLDRCWCDLSGGHLFDPYNITLWQLTSLSQTLGAAESQPVLITQEVEATSFKQENASHVARMSRAWMLKTTMEADELHSEGNHNGGSFINGSVVGWFRPAVPLSWPFRVSIPFPFNFGRRDSSDPSILPSPEATASGTDVTRSSLLRRKYDFRPRGINLVVDFGWGRSHD